MIQGRLYSFNSAPTINTTTQCSFIIHGFDLSGNGQVITKEICEANMNSLINKPVLVDYYYYGDNMSDHFGDHAVVKTTNRDTGEDMFVTNTIPIGVFTGVEIANIEDKDVLVGHAQLWSDRFYNCCSLLYETLNKGIDIKSSCEYMFCNYKMNEGVQFVDSPIEYEGHTILNSEGERGRGKIAPAYDESKIISFNQAILSDIQKAENNKQKGNEGETIMENKFLTALNNMSFGDIRDGIYEALRKVMNADEYSNVWLSSYATYNGYFIYETMEDDKFVTYKMTYNEKEDGGVDVDYEGKVRVTREEVWVEIGEAQASINTLQGEKEIVETSLNEANEKIATLEVELVFEKESKIELGEQVVSLNAQIEELAPYKEQLEQAQYEAKLGEATELYKEKFTALNGLETFDTEEVQELIKETLVVEDKEKSLNARATLADMLVGMVQKTPEVEVEKAPTPVKELCNKKIENLVPTKRNKYDEYGFEV